MRSVLYVMCAYMSFAVLQVAAPRMDMTLAELQEMATRQQQQIDAQQQLLASKVAKAWRSGIRS